MNVRYHHHVLTAHADSATVAADWLQPPHDDSAPDAGDDAHSDAPPPSTVVGHESDYEFKLDHDGNPFIANELTTVTDTLLFGLPDVDRGDGGLGACDARKLSHSLEVRLW